MSYTKKAFWSFSVIFICLALANVFGYLLRLVIARSLTPAEYGLIYAVMALLSFFGFAQTLGLSDALVNAIPGIRDLKRMKSALITVIYTQLIVTGTILLIVLLLARWLAAEYFGTMVAVPLLILTAIMVFISPIEVSLIAFFQGKGLTRWYGYLTLLRAVVLLAIVVALLALGFGVFAVMLGYVLMYLVIPVVYIPLMRKAFPEYWRVKARFDPTLLRRFIAFGFPIILASGIGFFLTYIDTFFLTLFRTLPEVGLYNAALPTAGLLWFVGGVIYAVMFPLSSEMQAKKGAGVLTDGIGRMYLYLSILLFPFAAIIVIYPGIILNLLFGGAYVGAALALQILVIGGVFYTFATLNSSIIAGLGHPRKALYGLVAAAVVNVIGDILFIPRYGIAGSAAVTLVAFIVLLAVHTVVLRKIVPYGIPGLRMAGVLLATAGAVGVVFLVRLTELTMWWKIGVGVLVAGIMYAVLLFALRVITVKELKDLKTMIGR
jgi:O-antigen/teichoic acid export membrane protein